MPVTESKPADVFAFGMFAVEVFTGKIPFEEQKNETVVLRISQGGRPEMPRNAQAVGLTAEMWNVLESCWQQSPKKRPTMQEVVRKWQRFIENDGDLNTFPECVQTTLVISGPCSVPFLTPRGSFRVPQSAVGPVEGPSRRRARTEATKPQLRTETDAPRIRTTSEKFGPRINYESRRPRATSGVVKTGSGTIPQSPNSDTQQSPRLEAIQQRPMVETNQQRPKVEASRPQVYDPPPSTSIISSWHLFHVVIHRL